MYGQQCGLHITGTSAIPDIVLIGFTLKNGVNLSFSSQGLKKLYTLDLVFFEVCIFLIFVILILLNLLEVFFIWRN